MTVPDGAWLVVGAAAVKRVWIDGVPVSLSDAGYIAISDAPVVGGEYLVELVPDEDLRLRAHLAFTTDPRGACRPEWISGSVLETELESGGLLQVASSGQCRVLVDGVEVGRQGGFDPYAEADIPRVRRYQVGAGTLTIESSSAVLVDGAAVSGPGWKGATVRRRQHGDPAALHLTPRPHPLPGAGWLDDRPTALPAGFSVPGATEQEVSLTVDLSPGTHHLTVDTATGPLTIPIPDDTTADKPRTSELSQGAEVSVVELRIPTRPGQPVLGGPIRFECGPGRMRLGDWESQGLAGYSGGVVYRTTTEVQGAATLDLGRVRGTAEVFVDGRSQGVRICAPYIFKLELQEERTTLEILVLGTLGPHLDEASPTHFVHPGQRVTGLFGPVRLAHTLDR